MSPRAAWRLESIGFTKVYDYVGGKADWFAAGLPREGLLTEVPRAGDAARQDDVTCRIDERAGDVAERLRAAAIDVGIVTTDGGVVLGRVRGRDLVGDQEKTIEETMESGPTTIRADTTLESIIGRLEDRSVNNILVTHSDGRLVGSLYLSDAQTRLDQYQLRQSEQRMDEGERCCMCKAD